MKKFLTFALFILISTCSQTPVFAQTPGLTPACSNPPPNYGVVWTSGQWIACLSSFQAFLGYIPLNKAGDTMSGELGLATSITSSAPLNFIPGVAPTSPNSGDLWFTSLGLYYRVGSSTVGPLVSSGSLSLTVGSTPIVSGTTTRVLYDNAGVLGEMTTTGSGTVLALQTSPSLITPVLGVASGTSLALGGASIGTDHLAVTGTATVSGNSVIGGTLSVNGASIAGNGLAVTGSAAVSTTANVGGTATIGSTSTDAAVISGGGTGATYSSLGGTTTVSSASGTTNLSDATVKLGNASYLSCGLLITNSSNNIVCSSLPASGLTFNDNVTSNTVASASNMYCMNTNGGALTLTLPASPTVGQKVAFIDCGGHFGANNLTIVHNGNNIMYAASDMVVSTPYAGSILIWSAGLTSWILSPS